MTKASFIRYLFFSFALGLVLSGCSNSDSWKKVDVSKEKASFTVYRFEQDLFAIDTNHIAASEARLRAKYGDFYDDYIEHIMNFGKSDKPLDTTHLDPHIDLIKFLGNRSDRDLYDTVEKEYSDISGIKAGLTDMLKHFEYYFPKKPPITRVYTFITEFSDGIATYDDSTLCIGLDMYLGSSYRYYESVGLPQFMIAKLKREYIIPNATEALYNFNFDRTAYNAQLPLIEAIINEGKKYYYMECLLPDAPDSLIMGYTAPQAEWCRKSEKSIWQYLNEQDLLFKDNYMEQKRYTTDGPSTTGMPPESPPKVGSWVGWQIVRKFMKDNRGKVSLSDLLDKYTAKQIFSLANYKPK
jgi:hypothetical protein